jgi:putative nucleotidyltransferase with HDIG domain
LPVTMIRNKIEQIDTLPTLPAILLPLLKQLDQPLDFVDVPRVVDLISHDEALAAQCLHMANSSLFGRWQRVDSIRGAVVALGVGRVREIATACSLMRLLPVGQTSIDPQVFWQHSLGCALVCRRLAKMIKFKDPEKAYLGGLLHDIGLIANILIAPDDFEKALQLAASSGMALDAAEREVLGYTHALSGELLAMRWHLQPVIAEVIRRHHDAVNAIADPALTSLVSLSDMVCRMCRMGHGHAESHEFNFSEEPAWPILASECPTLQNYGWRGFTSELSTYVIEVQRLVNVLFRVH